MPLVGARTRGLDFNVCDNGPRDLAAEDRRQPFRRDGVRCAGHIVEPARHWPRQALVSDTSTDFQRGQGRIC